MFGPGIYIKPVRGGTPIPPDDIAQAFFDAQEAAGNPVVGIHLTIYNNLAKALRAAGYHNHLDRLCIRATGGTAAYNRALALMDFLRPSKVDTISGAYSGDLTVNGFKGNGGGFHILQNWNPGDGGTYHYTRNDASSGTGLIDNNSVSPQWEEGSADAGFGSGYLIRGFTQDDTHGAGGINGAFFGANSYQKPVLSSYSVLGWNRSASNVEKCYLNGVVIEVNATASAAIPNQKWGEFGAYNGAFAGTTFDSINTHSFDYKGDSTIDQGVLMNILNTNFFIPLAIKAAMSKMIFFEGDSRTSDTSAPNLSNTYRYPRRVLTALGDNWVGTSVAKANDTVQNMIVTYAAEIGAYVNLNFSKNILSIFAGTNDIAASRTAAELYADIKTLGALGKASGFSVVLYTEIDRNWSSYIAMNLVRTTYNASLLLDFPTSLTSNIYTGGSYADILINLYAEVNFQSYLSAYYQVDGIHPSNAGSDKIGDYLKAAIDLL